MKSKVGSLKSNKVDKLLARPVRKKKRLHKLPVLRMKEVMSEQILQILT